MCCTYGAKIAKMMFCCKFQHVFYPEQTVLFSVAGVCHTFLVFG